MLSYDFLMLTHSCIPRINPHKSQCILLVYCWKGFAHAFSRVLTTLQAMVFYFYTIFLYHHYAGLKKKKKKVNLSIFFEVLHSLNYKVLLKDLRKFTCKSTVSWGMGCS